MQGAGKSSEGMKGILLLELKGEIGGLLVQEFNSVIQESGSLSLWLSAQHHFILNLFHFVVSRQ